MDGIAACMPTEILHDASEVYLIAPNTVQAAMMAPTKGIVHGSQLTTMLRMSKLGDEKWRRVLTDVGSANVSCVPLSMSDVGR